MNRYQDSGIVRLKDPAGNTIYGSLEKTMKTNELRLKRVWPKFDEHKNIVTFVSSQRDGTQIEEIIVLGKDTKPVHMMIDLSRGIIEPRTGK